MRRLCVLVLAASACGNKAAPTEAPVTTNSPPEVKKPTTLEPLTEPPVEGIGYWARPTTALDDYLALVGAAELERVEVSTPTALIRALGSNKVIVLTPGRYVFKDSDKLGDAADKAQLPRWSAQSKHYDENGNIHDLENLVIVSAGPRPAILLQPDTYAHALSFLRVKGLKLHNLVIGHRPERGFCRGGVVKIVDAANVAISESTLFGSGTEGLTLIGVDRLTLSDSVITDTTEQLSTMSHSTNIVYENVELVGNAGNSGELLRGFAIYKSTVTIEDSKLADNAKLAWQSKDSYGLLFYVDGDYDIGKWHIDRPTFRGADVAGSRVELRNVSIDGASTTRVIGSP